METVSSPRRFPSRFVVMLLATIMLFAVLVLASPAHAEVTAPAQLTGTQIHVTCDPSSVAAGSSTTCTAAVSGESSVTAQLVSWGSAGTGIFDSSECTLNESGTCSVSYTPTEVGDGTHLITAIYAGDAAQVDSFTLAVTGGAVTVTTTTTSTSTKSGSATIWTDQADYAPVDTPIIYGSGFLPNANITISVTRPEGNVNTWFTTSDDAGGFQTTYATDGLVEGSFTVTATDGTNTATTTFTDSSITCTPNPTTVGTSVACPASGVGGPDRPAHIIWYNASGAQQFSDACTSGSCPSTHSPGSTGTWTVKLVKDSDSSVKFTTTFVVNAATGTLKVVKHVVNDNGGTATANQWTMSVTGANPTPSSFPGAESPGTTVTVNALQAYSVSESGGPSGYSASYSSACSSTTGIAAGGTATCTVTNDDIGPKLTVTKTVTNDNGGTKVVGDFPLFVDTTSVTSGVQVTLSAGAHTVSETGLATYAATIDGDCASDGSITLALGDVKTCTITNDDIAPQLKIVKNAVGGDDAFGFTVTGPTSMSKTITTSGGTGDTGFFAINAGTYSVAETVPVGWKLVSSSCSSGTPASLTVSLGEEVTCTFSDQASFSAVTNLKNNQFRLIYTPFSPGPFKMAASNPGEFFDNVVFFTGSATGTVTLEISVPYPFVTQGSQPIHVFDGYAPGDFTSHGADITSKFTITGTSSKTPSNALAITLGDYTPPVSLGTTEVNIELTGPAPASGIVYVVIHLDYGFKGSNGWSGTPKTTGTYPATCKTGGTCASLPGWGVEKSVPITGSYTFDLTVGALHKTQSVTSINVFKNDPGIAGLIIDASNNPIPNVKVTISGPGVSAVVYTDEDGWYQYVFKYTGKAATFTITASSTNPSWTQKQTVTLKSNGYIEVDFQRQI